MASTFSVSLVDSGSQEGKFTIGSRVSTSAAKIYTFLNKFSDCGITGCSKSDTEAITAKSAEAGSNVDRKAIITLQKPATREIAKIVIPSPDETNVPTVQTQNGERVTDVGLADILGDWATMTGETEADWIAKRGTVVQYV
ncbi:MAG TPA: hypothetical protein VN278_08085 [Methanosarcina sp.]|nr:hypothetical protein [Methanosarcina sp.]